MADKLAEANDGVFWESPSPLCPVPMDIPALTARGFRRLKDKIQLPPSAMDALVGQNASRHGAMFFELEYLGYRSDDTNHHHHHHQQLQLQQQQLQQHRTSSTAPNAGSVRIRRTALAGLLDFSAPEGTVRIPPLIAQRLFGGGARKGPRRRKEITRNQHEDHDMDVDVDVDMDVDVDDSSLLLTEQNSWGPLTVRYMRLVPGTFAQIQPLRATFQEEAGESVRDILEAHLLQHSCLRVGDIYTIAVPMKVVVPVPNPTIPTTTTTTTTTTAAAAANNSNNSSNNNNNNDKNDKNDNDNDNNTMSANHHGSTTTTTTTTPSGLVQNMDQSPALDRHQQFHEIRIVSLEPARAVAIVDTDLAVDILPSEETQQAIRERVAAAATATTTTEAVIAGPSGAGRGVASGRDGVVVVAASDDVVPPPRARTTSGVAIPGRGPTSPELISSHQEESGQDDDTQHPACVRRREEAAERVRRDLLPEPEEEEKGEEGEEEDHHQQQQQQQQQHHVTIRVRGCAMAPMISRRFRGGDEVSLVFAWVQSHDGLGGAFDLVAGAPARKVTWEQAQGSVAEVFPRGEMMFYIRRRT